MAYFKVGPSPGIRLRQPKPANKQIRVKASHRFTGPNLRDTCLHYHSHTTNTCVTHMSWGSSVIVVLTTDWTTGIRRDQKQRIFPLTTVTRPAVRPNQPPNLLFLWVKRGRGVTLNFHPLLLSLSRMSRSYISSPLCVCMSEVGQIYFFTITCVTFGQIAFFFKLLILGRKGSK
jgi:hypothetical protein